jgi:hypothetical protein
METALANSPGPTLVPLGSPMARMLALMVSASD